ncbi:MAG: peptide ABC transporter substrate-binding protein, partial [Sphaerochaetaceae bacterium]|nr:peptide ABC transporter substrate-binding protein [Sphaerochaetaceae bacterium]
MKKVLSITLIILLVGVLFISCGKKEEAAKVETKVVTKPAAAPEVVPEKKVEVAPAVPAPAPAPAPAVPAEDAVVFKLVNGAEPESLDPHQIQGVPEHRIYETIFEGLVA